MNEQIYIYPIEDARLSPLAQPGDSFFMEVSQSRKLDTFINQVVRIKIAGQESTIGILKRDFMFYYIYVKTRAGATLAFYEAHVEWIHPVLTVFQQQ